MPPSIAEEDELDTSQLLNGEKLVVEVSLESKHKSGMKMTPVLCIQPYHDEIDRVPSRQSLGRSISQTVA